VTAGPGAAVFRDRLALHTWTLDTTPLAEVLRVARATGWPAVELRRIDFARARAAGQGPADVLALVGASGLRVACVGVEHGWMFADGAERARLLEAFAESCRWAAALGAPCVMSPVDFASGPVARAADSLREVAALAAVHGLRVALELQSQAPQFNTLAATREVVVRAGHPAAGLLLDTYHLERSGGFAGVADLEPAEIAYVQFSDVPRSGLVPGRTLDRLPPGQGSVPFREFFRLVAARGYAGDLSYEAPHPAAWARDPAAVAREALDAARACL
jgi:sugar phosphate isomerase/epimerase